MAWQLAILDKKRSDRVSFRRQIAFGGSHLAQTNFRAAMGLA
jgi:hypothetical protein